MAVDQGGVVARIVSVRRFKWELDLSRRWLRGQFGSDLHRQETQATTAASLAAVVEAGTPVFTKADSGYLVMVGSEETAVRIPRYLSGMLRGRLGAQFWWILCAP